MADKAEPFEVGTELDAGAEDDGPALARTRERADFGPFARWQELHVSCRELLERRTALARSTRDREALMRENAELKS